MIIFIYDHILMTLMIMIIIKYIKYIYDNNKIIID